MILRQRNGYGNDSHCKFLISGEEQNGEAVGTFPAWFARGGPGTSVVIYNSMGQDCYNKQFGNWSWVTNGTDQYLSVGARSSWVLSGDFTIEFWLMLVDDTDDWVGIFGNYYADSGETDQDGFNIYYRPNPNGLIFSFNDSGGGGLAEVVTIPYSYVSDSVFGHFAFVRIGSTLYAYANGTQVDSGAMSATIDCDDNLELGRQRQRSGLIDYGEFYIHSLRISNIARWNKGFKNSLPNRHYAGSLISGLV